MIPLESNRAHYGDQEALERLSVSGRILEIDTSCVKDTLKAARETLEFYEYTGLRRSLRSLSESKEDKDKTLLDVVKVCSIIASHYFPLLAGTLSVTLVIPKQAIHINSHITVRVLGYKFLVSATTMVRLKQLITLNKSELVVKLGARPNNYGDPYLEVVS